MKHHKHKFVAIPITGQSAGNGEEELLGWHLKCEVCGKQAKEGDTIVEVKQSWWKEIVPKIKPINYILQVNTL